jgi:hypothetical protein
LAEGLHLAKEGFAAAPEVRFVWADDSYFQAASICAGRWDMAREEHNSIPFRMNAADVENCLLAQLPKRRIHSKRVRWE